MCNVRLVIAALTLHLRQVALQNGVREQKHLDFLPWELFLDVQVVHRNELAVGARLVDDLPVDEEELLDLVVVAGDAEADHRHEQLGHHLAVERQRDQRLQTAHLLLDLECECEREGEGEGEGEGEVR